MLSKISLHAGRELELEASLFQTGPRLSSFRPFLVATYSKVGWHQNLGEVPCPEGHTSRKRYEVLV
jgi:hypothetical protein